MPRDVLAAIYAHFNRQLKGKNLPEVQYDVFSWRIARTIQYRTTCGCYNRLARKKRLSNEKYRKPNNLTARLYGPILTCEELCISYGSLFSPNTAIDGLLKPDHQP